MWKDVAEWKRKTPFSKIPFRIRVGDLSLNRRPAVPDAEAIARAEAAARERAEQEVPHTAHTSLALSFVKNST